MLGDAVVGARDEELGNADGTPGTSESATPEKGPRRRFIHRGPVVVGRVRDGDQLRHHIRVCCVISPHPRYYPATSDAGRRIHPRGPRKRARAAKRRSGAWRAVFVSEGFETGNIKTRSGSHRLKVTKIGALLANSIFSLLCNFFMKTKLQGRTVFQL